MTGQQSADFLTGYYQMMHYSLCLSEKAWIIRGTANKLNYYAKKYKINDIS